MKCPIDSTTMQIAERAGFEIDYCPECRGIWLDRGELDKLIERGSAPPPAPPPPPVPATGEISPAPDGGVSGASAAKAPSSIGSAAIDALRAVRELADAHKRKGSGVGRP